MLHDLPEWKKLAAILERNEIKIEIALRPIDARLLEQHPEREYHFHGHAGSFSKELHSLHQAVWERNQKLSLHIVNYVPGYVTPMGGPSPLRASYPVGISFA